MMLKTCRVLIVLCAAATLFTACSKVETAKKPDTDPGVIQPVPDTAIAPQADPTEVLVTIGEASMNRAQAQAVAKQMAMRQGISPAVVDQFIAQIGDGFLKQAVDQFVNDTLLKAEVKRRGIVAEDSDVDAMMATVSKGLPPGMTLEQALEAQGMTIDDLRSNIAGSTAIRKLLDTETAGVAEATDEEVTTFYSENTERFKTPETVAASHILIECKEDADEAAHSAARAEAEAVRKQLEEGGDFAALAKEKSACPSKEKGGALPPFGRGRMVPAFEEAAFSQTIGTIGPVVKTPFGYHVIKVTEKKEATTRTMEEASPEIREFLTMQAKSKVAEEFVAKLRAQTDITYAEGFAPEPM